MNKLSGALCCGKAACAFFQHQQERPGQKPCSGIGFLLGCSIGDVVGQMFDQVGHVEGFHKPFVLRFFRAGGFVTLPPVMQQVEIIGQHPQTVSNVCPLFVRQAALGQRQGDSISGWLVRVKPKIVYELFGGLPGIQAEQLGGEVDHIPGSSTAETVVLLSKGEIDSKKVRVEFSLEDMDMSGFQKGATYEQIKAYVLEHTGLKVSSLYISQIKRKCGLDVGQNYNLSKKEDAKVPQCPPEKEAAIRDALKYFQMI